MAMRSEGRFDLNELSRRIDDTRRERDLTWSEIAQQVDVATSTIRRFATASDAEADGVLALIGWLGVAPEQFVIDSTISGTLLPSTREGMIRVDMPLIAELPTWPRRSATSRCHWVLKNRNVRLPTTAESDQRYRPAQRYGMVKPANLRSTDHDHQI
jgi:hypothetical protein